MKKMILFGMLILLIFSCQKTNHRAKILGLDWIIGSWQNHSKEGKITEIWKKVNDSIYEGESYFVKEKDTLHSEKMQLKQQGEKLFYVSNIKGQNNDKPVIFSQNIEIENQLVFENSKNEYPKKITYQSISKDKMRIEISGIQQKKFSSIRFSMKRK